MKPKKIFIKLFLPYFFISFVGLIILLLITRYAFRNFYYNEINTNLLQKARIIEREVITLLQANDIAELESEVDFFAKNSENRISIITTDGVVVADSNHDISAMENHVGREEIVDALNGNIGESLRYSPTMMSNHLYLAIPLLDENQKIIGVLRNSVSIIKLENSLYSLTEKIMFWSMLLLFIVTYFIYFQARKLSLPLEKMKKDVEVFALSDFKEKLDVENSNTEEIVSLSFALKKMGEKLQSQIKKINKQKQEQLAVFSSLIEGVITIYPDMGIYHINKSALILFNKREQDVPKGTPLKDVINSTEILNLAYKLTETQDTVEGQISYGENRILHVYGTIVESEETGVFGAVLVFNDITKMRRLENHRKEFVANVSHELKTPLTAIQGYLETLQDPDLKDQKMIQKFLKIVNKHTIRLKLIIEDLLSLSSLERETEIGKIELTNQPVVPVLESAITLCSERALQKNVSIKISGDRSIYLPLSQSLFEQALINLLDNAIKYGNNGNEIDLALLKQERVYQVIVSDNGPGIKAEHHSRLFERFYSADKARSRELGGSGLGLSIVKHIIISHGGEIKLESEVGVGTKFIIEFPIEAENAITL